MPSKTVTLEIPAREAAKYEAAIDEYIAKIDRSLARNKRTQARIDRLKADTRAILARLEAQMN
jgi:hypothetical protein